MLEIKDISHAFNGKTALENVSLTVQDGEFVSILGPSGCGKTTLLRMIAGLETPQHGKIILDGQDITNVEPHNRNIHTVFQRYALFPHMNVFENVAFGLRCKKMSDTDIKKRVEDSLELANLQNKGTRMITTLSGGEQQRVALIRALVNMPKLLLLDEPLGALDAKLRLQIQNELVTLQKRVKTTFVFVTHDQQEALTMSDRIVVMRKGRVAQIGSSHEIYEFPQNHYVANFVGALNSLYGTVRNGKLSVEGLGEIKAEIPLTLQTDGTQIRLGLRPEKLSLYARPSITIDNCIEAQVSAQTYMGTHAIFEITLKNGTRLNVFQQSLQKLRRRSYQIGDKAYVAWTANMSHVFGMYDE